MNTMKKYSGKYQQLEGTGGVNLQRYLMLFIGIMGLFLFLVTMGALLLTGSAPLNGLIVGGFLSLLILASMVRTGLELDQDNRRFREFEGFRGRTKDPWIDVEDGDYLSIVGVIETAYGEDKTPLSTRRSAGKVFFWSGTWHLEVFKGNQKECQEFAETFSEAFDLPINDVMSDQDLPRNSQTSF